MWNNQRILTWHFWMVWSYHTARKTIHIGISRMVVWCDIPLSPPRIGCITGCSNRKPFVAQFSPKALTITVWPALGLHNVSVTVAAWTLRSRFVPPNIVFWRRRRRCRRCRFCRCCRCRTGWNWSHRALKSYNLIEIHEFQIDFSQNRTKLIFMNCHSLWLINNFER